MNKTLLFRFHVFTIKNCFISTFESSLFKFKKTKKTIHTHRTDYATLSNMKMLFQLSKKLYVEIYAYAFIGAHYRVATVPEYISHLCLEDIIKLGN